MEYRARAFRETEGVKALSFEALDPDPEDAKGQARRLGYTVLSFIWLVIGLIVLLMYFPIFDLARSLQ